MPIKIPQKHRLKCRKNPDFIVGLNRIHYICNVKHCDYEIFT